MRSTPKAPLTRAARVLKRLLKQSGQSVPDFCDAHDLNRFAVQRALNGDQKSFSVDFAYDLQRATNGLVKWRWWRRSTVKPLNVSVAKAA